MIPPGRQCVPTCTVFAAAIIGDDRNRPFQELGWQGPDLDDTLSFQERFRSAQCRKTLEPVSETTTQSKHQWLACACPGLSQAYVDGHRRHIGAQGIPAAYRLMPGPWLSPNRGFPVFRFARGPRQGLIWPVGSCVAMWGRGGACFPFLAPAWKTYVLHVAVYVPRVSPTYETCVFAADIRVFQEADMRLVRHTKHMFCIPGHARHMKHMFCIPGHARHTKHMSWMSARTVSRAKMGNGAKRVCGFVGDHARPRERPRTCKNRVVGS